jgi:PAS domain S-box-containing protein
MFQQTIKLLLLEDNPSDARLIREMLIEATHVMFTLKSADRLSNGLALLQEDTFDVLLMDLSLPDSQGLETLVAVHKHTPNLPIVVLTGFDDETTGIKAVQNGAQDYLVKGQVDSHLLVRALRYAIERQHIDAELEWERAKLRAILDSMGEGVIYNEDFQDIYTNHALVEMTGYEQQQFSDYQSWLRGTGVSENEIDHMYTNMQNRIESHGIWRGELKLRRRDGSEFDAGLTSTPVTSPQGKIGIVTIIRDISQEKALHEQKTRFVANASHELRTPLTNLRTTLYLMRRQPNDMQDHINVLEYVIDRMRGLVDDLLDMTRFERGTIPLQRRIICVQDIIHEVVRIQSAESKRKELTLSVELYPEPLYINADLQRITQVITNLLINAINYTPEGQWIKVSLDAEANQRALISIQDSGIGIPRELQKRIFQPFFRANEGLVRGTGLGLTITKEIVELHDGEINVESEFGQGSTFRVHLGLVQPEVSAAK